MISRAFAGKSTLYQRYRGKQVLRHACTIAALWIGFAVSPWIARASAQTADEGTNTDYERESENPVMRFYTLPLRYKSLFEDGFHNATTNSLELNNAVVPIPLDDDWFIMARIKGAYVSQAPKRAGNDGTVRIFVCEAFSVSPTIGPRTVAVDCSAPQGAALAYSC